MGGKRTTPAVLDYLLQNPGKTLSLPALARATGLTSGQVQSAVSNLRRKAEFVNAIEVLQRGQMWRYNAAEPTPADSAGDGLLLRPGDTLEIVGRAPASGDLIARDAEQILFRVMPL